MQDASQPGSQTTLAPELWRRRKGEEDRESEAVTLAPVVGMGRHMQVQVLTCTQR